MDSSVSGKDELWFRRVCHHVPHELYIQSVRHCGHCWNGHKTHGGVCQVFPPSYQLTALTLGPKRGLVTRQALLLPNLLKYLQDTISYYCDGFWE